jgi:hypothetical protein
MSVLLEIIKNDVRLWIAARVQSNWVLYYWESNLIGAFFILNFDLVPQTLLLK